MDTNQINDTEEKMARQIGGLLNERAQHLSAETIQRLSVARNLAVEQLSAQQSQSLQQNCNLLTWLGGSVGQYFGHHRAMSAAMLAGVMMLTFFAAQQLEKKKTDKT